MPNCGLVISSRPHASVTLREQATVQVNILGFTKKEQKLYIQQTLKGQPEKIEELTKYLKQHWRVSSLCYVSHGSISFSI